mmetsp:Transcript_78224/g.253918  ORF Transcript_78224/g.253918 Transcript_78224/m.253918 type:complete len:205 (+) Transcript_78224:300-914(+)
MATSSALLLRCGAGTTDEASVAEASLGTAFGTGSSVSPTRVLDITAAKMKVVVAVVVGVRATRDMNPQPLACMAAASKVCPMMLPSVRRPKSCTSTPAPGMAPQESFARSPAHVAVTTEETAGSGSVVLFERLTRCQAGSGMRTFSGQNKSISGAKKPKSCARTQSLSHQLPDVADRTYPCNSGGMAAERYFITAMSSFFTESF